MIVNEEEVIIPEGVAQVVTLEQAPPIRVTEAANLIFAVVALIAIGLGFYRRFYTKPLHMIYVSTWMAHYLLYAMAQFLNRIGLLTIDYSDTLFVRWGVLINTHILLIGAVTVVVYYIEAGKKRGP